jgi:hypothetical protein
MPLFPRNNVPTNEDEMRQLVNRLYQNVATLEKKVVALENVAPAYSPVARGVDGNISLFGTKPNFQGLDRGMFVDDTYRVPTAVPKGGGFIYSNSGALTWKSPANQGISSEILTSTVDAGTAPLVVSSATKVSNLNADQWDDLDAPANAAGYLLNNGSGTLSWGRDVSVAYKTDNETVNNSDTYQNDDHLSIAVAASTAYFFSLVIQGATANATPGIKFQLTGPTGMAGELTYLGVTTGTTAVKLSGTAWGNAPIAIEDSALWSGIVAPAYLRAEGTILTSSTAGNVVLQWAQYTAHASDTTFRKGSSLVLIKQ